MSAGTAERREVMQGLPGRADPIGPTAEQPIVRLTDDGPDWGVEPEPGDEIGYAMHPTRTDGCFRASTATVTQTPIEEVPELAIDDELERGRDPAELNRDAWALFHTWADQRGLRMRLWRKPLERRRRWLGVTVATPEDLERRRSMAKHWAVGAGYLLFPDHICVMCRGHVLFDPLWSHMPPEGYRHRTRPGLYWADEVTYGITFDRKPTKGTTR